MPILNLTRMHPFLTRGGREPKRGSLDVADYSWDPSRWENSTREWWGGGGGGRTGSGLP